jgi:predicted O-linked N-acetylglucosamine transferase (SPINDLY family)
MAAVLDLRREAANLARSGRMVEALLVLRRLAREAPAEFGTQYNLGFALQHLGRWDEAIAAYGRAIELNPGFADAQVNLGNCLQHQGRFEEALERFRAAVATHPGHTVAQFNLGLLLQRQERWEASVEPLRAAQALAPADMRTWDRLYDALMKLRRPDEAIEAFLAFEGHAAPSPALAVNGLTLARLLTDREREARYLGLCLDWPFPAVDAGQLAQILAQIQYFDVSGEQILSVYQRYANLMEGAGFESYSAQLRRTRGARIRVGYLSPDFRIHVMGKLMRHVFRLHDPERFEVYAFSLTDERHEDALTGEFRELARRYVNVSAMSDAQAARLIADHDLDILVDLAGHTVGARPEILAHKPARVIITHLGYHGAIGLRTVDYKLTDRLADDAANERFQIEKLLFMDRSIFPFDHVEASDAEVFTKERFGLEGRFVFGEFVNAMKLSPRLLDTWARVMRELPEAVVAFSPIVERDESILVRAMQRAGVDRERIAFLPTSKDDGIRRARYRVLDAVLDTFPYSGGDTTLAALDAGVPVVTLRGKRHAERTSTSILGHLGLEDTIAGSEDEYVAMAVRLGRDADFRKRVGDKLADAMARSRRDGLEGYVRSLEAAYEHALREKGIVIAQDTALSADEFQGAFRTALARHEAGELEAAHTAYEALLLEQPDFPPLCYFLAMLLRAQGNKERARDLLRRAVASTPSYGDAFAALGNIELDRGDPLAAQEAFVKAVALRPERVDAWNGLGLARSATGDDAGAIEAHRRAIQAGATDPLGHFNLAVALTRARHFDEARASYRVAIALDPGHVDALYNYGLLLGQLGFVDLAMESWRRALAADARFEPAYWQLRHTLHAAGRLDDWVANFEAYARHCPHSKRLALYAIDVAFHRGDLDEAARRFREAVETALREPDDTLAGELLEELLYVALFFPIEPAEMLALYRRYDAASRALHPQLPLLPPREPGGRIRVGYLSADLRDHVMGKMAFEIASRHDRAAFELFAFSLSLQRDAWTERIDKHFDHFEGLAGLPERAAAQAIARHRLDLLVDLSTHTRGSQPAILAYKPARVQLSHVASAGAPGLSTVDYRLTDARFDRPEDQAFLIEKLLPMEGCVFPWRTLVPATRPLVGRFALEIPEDAFVFGAFVQLQKLSAPLLALWREILKRSPRSLLAFSPLAASARRAYERVLEANGIHPSLAVFIPQGADEAASQSRYLLVDAVLDTFPYSGTNGTMEALSQGVPVVTLVGERASQRSSYTILANAGLEETIARTPREYAHIAVRLATDRAFADTMRAAIAQRLPGSVLADNAGHVRHLEDAYRRALAQSGVDTGHGR